MIPALLRYTRFAALLFLLVTAAIVSRHSHAGVPAAAWSTAQL